MELLAPAGEESISLSVGDCRSEVRQGKAESVGSGSRGGLGKAEEEERRS